MLAEQAPILPDEAEIRRKKRSTARQIEICGDYARVPLTRGLSALVDIRDVETISDINWCSLVMKHTVYAVTNIGSRNSQRTVFMHRLIMGEDAVDSYVDHIDGDGTNNRRGNLRAVTPSQNRYNSRARSDNTSGARGVFLNKNNGKWYSRIGHNGNKIHIGTFSSFEEAKSAYIAASIELHGEFRKNG